MTIFFDVKLKKRFCLMTSNFQSFIQIFSLHKLNRFKRKMGVFNSCKIIRIYLVGSESLSLIKFDAMTIFDLFFTVFKQIIDFSEFRESQLFDASFLKLQELNRNDEGPGHS